jgi:hypothetical protein
MQLFWKPFTEKILTITGPQHVIVEIGSATGINTLNLVDYCIQHSSTIHCIDPLPIGNWDKIGEKFKQIGTHHKKLSLEVLDEIKDGTIYFVDGDHNYYTVFNECKKIFSHPNKKRIALFHDVEWPYGRRDLYYDYTNIPQSELNEYKFWPVKQGEVLLQENEGMNFGQCHAFREGGAKNGVRTAIEDFAHDNKDISLFSLIGFHGLMMVYRPQYFSEKINLELKEIFSIPPHLVDFISELEKYRFSQIEENQTKVSNLLNNYQHLQTASLAKSHELIDKYKVLSDKYCELQSMISKGELVHIDQKTM